MAVGHSTAALVAATFSPRLYREIQTQSIAGSRGLEWQCWCGLTPFHFHCRKVLHFKFDIDTGIGDASGPISDTAGGVAGTILMSVCENAPRPQWSNCTHSAHCAQHKARA